MLTDFHSHVLPGIDDGSDSVETSLAMLQAAADQSVETMMATPHFYAHNDTPEHFLKNRAEAEETLRAAMEGKNLPRLIMGAEVYYFPGICDAAALQQLTLGNSCFVLVEMPMSKWTEDMYGDLEQIELKQGLIPVIAHIDRYLTFFNRRSVLRRLSKMQVLVQANSWFFRNPKTRRYALKLLKKGKIHLLGSDCHDMTHRKPDMLDAVEIIRRADRGHLDWIKSWEADILK